MKYLFVVLTFLLLSTIARAFEAEDEIPTLEEFNAVQKKARAVEAKQKHPLILKASYYIKNPQAYMNKQFRYVILLQNELNPIFDKNRKVIGCQFKHYIEESSLINGPTGIYSFTGDRKQCDLFMQAAEADKAAGFIVKFIGLVRFISDSGETFYVPEFKLVNQYKFIPGQW